MFDIIIITSIVGIFMTMKGDIKITAMEISQNTVESCLDVNSDPFDGN